MNDLVEFLVYAVQGFKIIFNFILKILLLIPYTIKLIFSKIFEIPKILSKIKINKEHKNIEFDEFNDIEEWSKQEEKKQQELEHKYTVLEKSVMESFIDKNNNGTVLDDINELNKNIVKIKKDLYNFQVLDSVNIKQQNVVEGAEMQEIKENYGEFDIDLFKNWSMQIFKIIKIGTEIELETIKKVMTEQMYNNFINQIKRLKNDGLEFITEELAISNVSLYDYAKGMSKEEIKILIIAKMKEYIINKNTGEVIRGNRKKTYEKKVVMTFLKQDEDEKEGFITNCPNCGASTSKIEFGRCAYCGTLLFPIRYNWTLIKFETV